MTPLAASVWLVEETGLAADGSDGVMSLNLFKIPKTAPQTVAPGAGVPGGRSLPEAPDNRLPGARKHAVKSPGGRPMLPAMAASLQQLAPLRKRRHNDHLPIESQCWNPAIPGHGAGWRQHLANGPGAARARGFKLPCACRRDRRGRAYCSDRSARLCSYKTGASRHLFRTLRRFGQGTGPFTIIRRAVVPPGSFDGLIVR